MTNKNPALKMVYEKRRLEISYKSIDEVIEILQALMEEIGPEARFEIEEEWGCYYPCVEWKRPENASERRKRLEKERENKEWRRKQYKKLKEEFEK